MRAERQATVERWRTNIPSELQELDQWVLWRKEERNGKMTKVPYCPTGRWGMARSTDPATWGCFKGACNLFAAGAGHGLGFVFSEHDPYCGVDFDHCVVGGVVESEKSPYVCDLNSYTEKSQSGNGIHVIVKATLEAGRKSTEHGIEMYDRARFFVMTGDMLGLSGAINEAQETVDYMLETLFPKPVENVPVVRGAASLSDQELIERMCRFNPAASRLWRGDMSRYGGDHSSADFALCGCINFWTANDMAATDRIFRQSPLYRPQKWERKATAELTYGQLTIMRAMSRNVYKGR